MLRSELPCPPKRMGLFSRFSHQGLEKSWPFLAEGPLAKQRMFCLMPYGRPGGH